MGLAEYYSEIDRAISACEGAANPEWLREFTACAYIAACENAALDIGTIWAVFDRRGSRLKTRNKLAVGGVMRRMVKDGWVRREPRPAGIVCKTNHNIATGYYVSLIYGTAHEFPPYAGPGTQAALALDI